MHNYSCMHNFVGDPLGRPDSALGPGDPRSGPDSMAFLLIVHAGDPQADLTLPRAIHEVDLTPWPSYHLFTQAIC